MSFRIEHRIGIAAPPTEVWDLVYDLAGWKDWTELYTEASGRVGIGETLSFTFKLGDRPAQSYKAKVYDWVPEHQMAWTTSFLRGWVRSLRYVEIVKLDETSCILANGDYWSGPLAGFMPRALRRQAREGFQRMNENAKRIVEARFAEKGGVVRTTPDAPSDEGFTIVPLAQPSLGPRKMWGQGAGGSLGPKIARS